jgi:aminoglycoside phosphotransferase (APT) family kinase protein
LVAAAPHGAWMGTEFADLLTTVMTRAVGPGALSALARLSGGASMESWSFDWAGSGYVLRRAPTADYVADRPFGHADEAALVRAAHAAGVKAPAVVAVLECGDGLGSGYVMRRVGGDANPAAILANPPPTLLTDLAHELARIHAMPTAAIPAGIPLLDTAAALSELKARFADYGGDRPVIALAIKWCENHLPAPADPPVLVHGDFRMGNLLVDADGLSAVLDWELAHRGDHHEDLAYGCMTVWRFARPDQQAFGLGALDDFFAAYRAAGGAPVDPARFYFWLVYRTLWWALGCLGMGAAWRDGVDRSLERVVVARRTAEQELDLLTLLEGDAPEAERARAMPPPAAPVTAARGEPCAAELVTAVREWLASDIKPGAQGRDKFMVAVAMNALGIAARELGRPVDFADKALADALLLGERSLAEPGLLAQLRRQCLDKLAGDMPKYPALAIARSQWGAEP